MIRREPTLCTIAPVIGVNIPNPERITAIILIRSAIIILIFIVLTVALDKSDRYGIFSISSFNRTIEAASVVISLPIPSSEIPTLDVLRHQLLHQREGYLCECRQYQRDQQGPD